MTGLSSGSSSVTKLRDRPYVRLTLVGRSDGLGASGGSKTRWSRLRSVRVLPSDRDGDESDEGIEFSECERPRAAREAGLDPSGEEPARGSQLGVGPREPGKGHHRSARVCDQPYDRSCATWEARACVPASYGH